MLSLGLVVSPQRPKNLNAGFGVVAGPLTVETLFGSGLREYNELGEPNGLRYERMLAWMAERRAKRLLLTSACGGWLFGGIENASPDGSAILNCICQIFVLDSVLLSWELKIKVEDFEQGGEIRKQGEREVQKRRKSKSPKKNYKRTVYERVRLTPTPPPKKSRCCLLSSCRS